MDNNNMIIKTPVARKTHRKTRTGCRTCKQRKIKCDEQRPSCTNCIKHSVQCDFLLTNRQAVVQPRTGGSGVSTHTNSTPQSSSNVGTPVPINQSPTQPTITTPISNLPSLNMLDLELLNNYITATASTLHTDPAMKTIWRLNVTQVGFQYEYVMRAILALSALHLAFYRPERREFYIDLARQQHQAGLRMSTSVLQYVTEENCTAVYLFGALTLFCTLGSPRKPGELLFFGENGIADWGVLAKGTIAIIESNQENLTRGPVGPMFVAGRRRMELRNELLARQDFQDDPLSDLSTQISQSLIDPHHKQIYQDAIAALRPPFHAPLAAGHETADVFTFMFTISNEYLGLLAEHTQESLAIFSFFCVVLKRLDAHWWMQGWSTHLLEHIWGLLDEEHKAWVRWPVEEIGWIPT